MNRTGLLLVGLVAGAMAASAQYTNRSSVLDGSGTRSAGGSYTNLSAAGQPGGIAVASGGGFVNQAGFLNTFFLKPSLDTDGDGLADELDEDNDQDGLADMAEVSGSAFDPTTATLVNRRDTDDDGQTDGQEAAAGTNPLDPLALLELVSIQRGAAVDLAWYARSNKTYRVLYAESPVSPITNVLTTVTALGPAAAPWYALTNTVPDAASTNRRAYAIQLVP